METTIMSERGQLSVPAEVRKRRKFKGGQKFAWLDDGIFLKLVPLPDDPLEALYGCAKGENLTEALMKYRQEERAREK